MAENPDKYLILVGGPTASGKTSLAIRLAKLFETEIVSADSRQLYRELNVAVARPSEEELTSVPHHFIADYSVTAPLNAGSYAAEAREVIDTLFVNHSVVIVAGGTGLYLKALLEGFDPLPPADEKRRAELEALYREKGIGALQEVYYKTSGSEFASKEVEMQNPQRLIRAIEIAENQDNRNDASIPPFKTSFKVIKWCIDMDRALLYERINQRVDQMIAEGMEDEARALLPYRHLNPLRTVGYSEWFLYFDSEISKQEATDKIRQHTRNYAKRQLTWFRKDPEVQWIVVPETLEELKSLLPLPLSSFFRM